LRYIPLTSQDEKQMLQDLGLPDTQDLFTDIPDGIRRGPMQGLPISKSESELRSFFYAQAAQNINPHTWRNFLGAGCYDHYIPAIVGQLAGRGEFLTAYTPYQAEISQGTLQVIFEYQSMIASLTGMEVANASMYDGASAAAEAALMSLRVNKGKHVYVSGGLHPDYIKTIRTYLSDYEVEIHILPLDENGHTKITDLKDQTSCVLVGLTNIYGVVEPLDTLAKQIHDASSLLVAVVQESFALPFLKSPGACGADIVAGEGQSLGVEMNFGGPHVGIFATRKKFVRLMPGRLAGKTKDTDGNPGYVLTLSTREQHIRREKATSNICTNNALCALKSCIFMATMGKAGLMKTAAVNHHLAKYAFDQLLGIKGVKATYTGAFFNEFVIELPIPAAQLIANCASKHIIPGVPLSQFDPKQTHALLVCVTETKTQRDIDDMVEAIRNAL